MFLCFWSVCPFLEFLEKLPKCFCPFLCLKLIMLGQYWTWWKQEYPLKNWVIFACYKNALFWLEGGGARGALQVAGSLERVDPSNLFPLRCRFLCFIRRHLFDFNHIFRRGYDGTCTRMECTRMEWKLANGKLLRTPKDPRGSCIM